MKPMTLEEAENWLIAQNGVSRQDALGLARRPEAYWYSVRADSLAKVVDAQILTEACQPDGAVAFLYDEDIWACTDTKIEFYETHVRGWGHQRSFAQSQGWLLSDQDRDGLSQLAMLGLWFVWSMLYVERGGEFVIEISHDEVIGFYASDPDRRRELDEAMLCPRIAR